MDLAQSGEVAAAGGIAMGASELIALAAVLVAALSAFFAWKANDAAKEANAKADDSNRLAKEANELAETVRRENNILRAPELVISDVRGENRQYRNGDEGRILFVTVTNKGVSAAKNVRLSFAGAGDLGYFQFGSDRGLEMLAGGEHATFECQLTMEPRNSEFFKLTWDTPLGEPKEKECHKQMRGQFVDTPYPPVAEA